MVLQAKDLVYRGWKEKGIKMLENYDYINLPCVECDTVEYTF